MTQRPTVSRPLTSEALRVTTSMPSTPNTTQRKRVDVGASIQMRRNRAVSPLRSLLVPSRDVYAAHAASSDRILGNGPRFFAVMRKIGSLYEEMARQLESTGLWESVFVKEARDRGELLVASTGHPLRLENVALVLGEKVPAERFVTSRRFQLNKLAKHRLININSLVSSDQNDETLVVNCVEGLRCITLKGSMVSTLLAYYSQSWEELGVYLPMTFRLTPRKPKSDERGLLLRVLRHKYNLGTLWIAKSSSGCHGENVEIFRNDATGVKRMLNYVDEQKDSYMWVVQMYIDRPLLYHRRKFDIRCWILLCAGRYEIYVHEQLVMRMSSVEYSTESATTRTVEGRLAHITNHCVQVEGEGFSAFEEGNELWREHLDSVVRYKGKRMRSKGIQHEGANPELEPSLKNTVLPQIYHIVVETLLAARGSIPNGRSPPSTPCFQIFGYDFLIDEMLRVWLLEINGAPGAADRLLPALVADTIEIALTPFFPDTTKAAIHRKGITKSNGYVKVHP
ncbi:tubulin---tyrosine ligase [Trypanosoma grayi]|uniref:tubulin---tyrosine ligase n=1 Tax=Trypanosoma grayi TaxID=71804 RepID=UPI0004F435CD|nr:tubulin---tyrosine ligase [Trypanosoma grayi]KEG10590.1 tubulin---tyrosine ligase [Trypanosoma grayi]